MNVFGDKLKEAGIDTLGPQIIALLTEGCQLHRHSVVDAWRFVGDKLGYELARKIMKDMESPAHIPSPSTPLSRGVPVGRAPSTVPPIRLPAEEPRKSLAAPSDSPPPSVETLAEQPKHTMTAGREPTKAEMQSMLKAHADIARSILDKRFTSSGARWSKVTPREFPGMKRDAAIVRKFESFLGPLNDLQKNMALEDLLTPKQAELAFEQVDADEAA